MKLYEARYLVEMTVSRQPDLLEGCFTALGNLEAVHCDEHLMSPDELDLTLYHHLSESLQLPWSLRASHDQWPQRAVAIEQTTTGQLVEPRYRRWRGPTLPLTSKTLLDDRSEERRV